MHYAGDPVLIRHTRSEIMPCSFRPILAAALLFAAFPSFAQTAPAAGIDQDIVGRIPERMRHFVDDKTVAGVVTLVARGNEIVEFDAQGMADIEANRPMRKDTIFQIMSMTKPVTAIGIMMLAEEGKLSRARSCRAVSARVQKSARRCQHRPRRSAAQCSRARHHDSRPAHPHRGNDRRRAGGNQAIISTR